MQLEPGMRVRCVDAYWGLVHDKEYTVRGVGPIFVFFNEIDGYFLPCRFKPIFRVKMGRCYGNCDGLCNALGCAKT